MPQKESIADDVLIMRERCDREKVEQCEFLQRELRLNTHKRFTDLEQSALQVDSKEAFDTFWEKAWGDKSAFDKNRSHGWRRPGQKVISAASWASDFIHNLDPLVNIVKDFGAPFGGMAIGTICFLLTV